MTKATIVTFLQRADGWCESVKGKIFPLFELPARSRKVRTLYRTVEWLEIHDESRGTEGLLAGIISNLGGNTDSFRPMVLWGGRIFFIV